MAKVTTSQGTLIGGKCKTDNGFEYIEFLQIPYAKPPVGDLRFKNPQPPDSWTGERDATRVDKEKIACQVDIFTKSFTGSEDCLYLNVYTPRILSKDAQPLPVMVFIHGGGFQACNGIVKAENGPEHLIEKDVVIVSINYRLNVFGFLSLDLPEAPGNMALKDQVMALKWVQNNIHEFGGDKNNVTLFGISAGSCSISYLILSPLASNLFHKAILQSGSSLNHWAFNKDIVDSGIKLALNVGYKGSLKDNKAIHEYLLQQTPEVLATSAAEMGMEKFMGLDFGFVPCLEKNYKNCEAFLTEHPYDVIKEGKFNKVPIMSGFCEFEGLLCVALKPENIRKVLKTRKFCNFLENSVSIDETTEYEEKFRKAYCTCLLPTDDEEQFAINFFGDLDFIGGIWVESKMIARHGIPVYTYLFKYDGGLNVTKKCYFNISNKGASHGDDGGYLLKFKVMDDIKPSPTDVLVRDRMVKMWTDFAKTGNPTPSKSELITVQWPLFNNDDQKYLIIDDNLSIATKHQPERMNIFEEIYKKEEAKRKLQGNKIISV